MVEEILVRPVPKTGWVGSGGGVRLMVACRRGEDARINTTEHIVLTHRISVRSTALALPSDCIECGWLRAASRWEGLLRNVIGTGDGMGGAATQRENLTRCTYHRYHSAGRVKVSVGHRVYYSRRTATEAHW